MEKETVNVWTIENKYKKEMIEFNHQKKVEQEHLKLLMFEKKQKMMQENMMLLWKMKNDFQDKQNTQQLHKLYLYNKSKENRLADEDFNEKVKQIAQNNEN